MTKAAVWTKAQSLVLLFLIPRLLEMCEDVKNPMEAYLKIKSSNYLLFSIETS